MTGVLIKFDPPSLQAELCSALVQLADVLPEVDHYEIASANFDPNGWEDDIVINADTVFDDVSFADTDCNFQCTVAQLVRWADFHRRARLIDGFECAFETETLFRLEPTDNVSRGFQEALTTNTRLIALPPDDAPPDWDARAASAAAELRVRELRESLHLAYTHEGKQLSCRIVSGPTALGVVALRDLSFDEYTQPIHSDDLTLVIEHGAGSDRGVIRALAEGFLFELSASHGIALDFSPFLSEEELHSAGAEIEDHGEHFRDVGTLRLRPLRDVGNAAELLALCRRASGVAYDEFAILNYVRVVEYVAATVEKRALHSALRRRLLAADALNPNADFIDAVIRTVDENNKGFRKDADAIRLAIEECCAVELLVAHAPPFLQELKKLKADSTADARSSALKKVAEAFVSTRNEIAHAKPTYKRTGLECPPDQLGAFRSLAGKIAEHAVRWFLEVPPHQRITSAP